MRAVHGKVEHVCRAGAGWLAERLVALITLVNGGVVTQHVQAGVCRCSLCPSVLQLSDKLAASQERVAKLEADTLLPAAKNKAALAAASHAPRAAPGAGTGSLATSRTSNVAPGVVYDAQRWYLHACVALAGLGLRWWLLHQTDPLQQKIMLVVVWPVSDDQEWATLDHQHRSSLAMTHLDCGTCRSFSADWCAVGVVEGNHQMRAAWHLWGKQGKLLCSTGVCLCCDGVFNMANSHQCFFCCALL
jgi:hypothetical protein